MLFSIFFIFWIMVIFNHEISHKIKVYIIRYCNGFFFNKYFLENSSNEITEIINACIRLSQECKSNNEFCTLKLTFEQSHFFKYFKISDAGGYNIFIGPVYTKEENDSKSKIKPFICYSKKTENMGIKDIKDRLFYLKLFKEHNDE